MADRYIPRALSQRIKIGFWTTVFQRMEVAEEYFADSYVRELFELTRPQMAAVVKEADQDLRMRLLHLDVWGQVCLRDLPRADLTAKLSRCLTIRPG